MDTPEFARFRDVMNGMAKLYEREIDAAVLDAYWLALRSWSISEFEQAAAHLMGSRQFMPRPFDFNELRKASRPTAGEAWARAVLHAASSAYRDGPLGEEPTDTCVRCLGGYVAIAMCDEDKLHYLERRFVEHYEAKQDADETREALPELTREERPRAVGLRSIQRIGRGE